MLVMRSALPQSAIDNKTQRSYVFAFKDSRHALNIFSLIDEKCDTTIVLDSDGISSIKFPRASTYVDKRKIKISRLDKLQEYRNAEWTILEPYAVIEVTPMHVAVACRPYVSISLMSH